jgi:hypothetical protein
MIPEESASLRQMRLSAPRLTHSTRRLRLPGHVIPARCRFLSLSILADIDKAPPYRGIRKVRSTEIAAFPFYKFERPAATRSLPKRAPCTCACVPADHIIGRHTNTHNDSGELAGAAIADGEFASASQSL